MKWVVYRLFVGGCRSMLIQLLVTSESEIRKRQAAMDRYAPLFEQWIVPQITELAELETMQRKLGGTPAREVSATTRDGDIRGSGPGLAAGHQ